MHLLNIGVLLRILEPFLKPIMDVPALPLSDIEE